MSAASPRTGTAFLRFCADNRAAWELLSEGASRTRPRRRGQAALILELMRELAPYEGVAHWMWEQPGVPVDRLAEWTVELLLPGLRRFT